MTQQQQRIGIVGAGSMGSNLCYLFAEHNYEVCVWDKEGNNVDLVLENASKDEKLKGKIEGFKSETKFMESFKSKKILFFSLSHGKPVDEVLDKLEPHLKKDDIIIDGGNEWWQETERRQARMTKIGVRFIGTGVSGGYQSARRGPSMSPSGDKQAYEEVKSILEDVAAKNKKGEPCVALIGPGGSGHYVKMVHNGIEQGMLSVVTESYGIMRKVFGMSNDEIGKVYAEWNDDKELAGNFLLKICSEICPWKNDKGGSLVDDIEDKVVQDTDKSEGTGTWSVKEHSERHVPGPTVACAHFFRVASSHRDERVLIHPLLKIDEATSVNLTDRTKALEELRLATYGGILASFIQGLNLIVQVSEDEKWNLTMATIIHIWRAGCIIQSDYIADVLQKVYVAQPSIRNILASEDVAGEVNKTLAALKSIVIQSITHEAHVPALSASLEYFKAYASTNLPTNFMEAQLDYFGVHKYDLKGEHSLDIKKGKHHTEWKPA